MPRGETLADAYTAGQLRPGDVFERAGVGDELSVVRTDDPESRRQYACGPLRIVDVTSEGIQCILENSGVACSSKAEWVQEDGQQFHRMKNPETNGDA